MRAISPRIQKTDKSAENKLKFVFRNQELGSDRAIILPIWVVGQFRPTRVRTIGGGADFLLRANIIEKVE